jgi:hypothetical protein
MRLQLWDTRFATLAVREVVRLARVVLWWQLAGTIILHQTALSLQLQHSSFHQGCKLSLSIHEFLKPIPGFRLISLTTACKNTRREHYTALSLQPQS